MRKLYKLFLITFLCLGAYATNLKAQVVSQDSLALVDIYNATNGQSWNTNTNWLSTEPVSQWFGVTVDTVARRVIGIYLKGNNLVGNIPASIGNLTGLSSGLHLENNSLSGTIPSSIGNLNNLSQLALAGNKLTGPIPNSIGNLSSIVYLDFSFNKFIGSIPTSIGSLHLVTNLFFNSNNLTGTLPPIIGNMNSLVYFFADYNQLSDTIPASLGNLNNLLILSLGNNNFTGTIPQSFGNLTKLKQLDLSVNQLTGTIPHGLGNLAMLNSLTLQYNQLSGCIPKEIGNLKYLTTLTLNNNQLSGRIPSTLSNLIGVNNFQIQNNNFTFAGLEAIASKASYSPQANVAIKQNLLTLSFSVGGTPSNNTYNWYKDGALVTTVSGDSTYILLTTGKYWVSATNAVANQLVLFSDTVIISSLPVSSINLQTKEYNGHPLLEWQTINELNTVTFYLESSTDAQYYQTISSENAIGSGSNRYSFIDENYVNNQVSNLYYRIKTIDKDGVSYYSNIATYQLPINNHQLSIYPNPTKEKITIKGIGINAIQIINYEGKSIKSIEINNDSNPSVMVDGLLKGIYQVVIHSVDGSIQTIKLVKE